MNRNIIFYKDELNIFIIFYLFSLSTTALSRRLTMHLNDSSSTTPSPNLIFLEILVENTTIITLEISNKRKILYICKTPDDSL